MEIKDAYYKWLLETVGEQSNGKFGILLYHLFNVDFTWIAVDELDRDHNRAGDGKNLRDDFVCNHPNLDRDITDDELDSELGNVSVLEVLIGIAKRIDDILYDPEEDSKVKEYFWIMIRNLGLYSQNDANFSMAEVEDCLYIWMNRQYDGHGNPCNILKFKHDIGANSIEIWYQIHEWVGENYPNRFDF